MKKNLLNPLIAFVILCIVVLACEPEAPLMQGTTVKGTYKIVHCVDDTCKQGWYPNIRAFLVKMTPQIQFNGDTSWVYPNPIAVFSVTEGKVDQEFIFENVPTGRYEIGIQHVQTPQFELGSYNGFSKIFDVKNESEINVGVIEF